MTKRLNAILIALIVFAPSFVLAYMNSGQASAFCPPGKYSAPIEGGSSFECTPVDAEEKIATKVQESTKYIQNTAVTIAGVSLGLSVLVIVYSGILYTASGGDPKKIQEAKSHLTKAGVGLAISLLSFVIYNILTTVIGF